MSGEAVDRAVRRVEARRPDLNMAVQAVAGGLTAGEGAGMIHQAALQQYLWWYVPRDYPHDEWQGLVEAAAALLDELGLPHLAEVARIVCGVSRRPVPYSHFDSSSWSTPKSRHHRSGAGTWPSDWGSVGPLHIFCAVLAWSRVRFMRFALDETAATTFGLLAQCFEALGGVPKVVLADRMGCLKAGVVMNVVVPTAAYVRFAAHYGFRPDFCEGHDPESKGIVENLVGYAKRDLVVPAEPSAAALPAGNAQAARWCDEVNASLHSEICAVPKERLEAERPLLSLRPTIGKVATRKVDKLSCVRFGSARYSAPITLIGPTVEVHVASDRVRPVHLGRPSPGGAGRYVHHRRSSTTTTAVLVRHRGGRLARGATRSGPSWRSGRRPRRSSRGRPPQGHPPSATSSLSSCTSRRHTAERPSWPPWSGPSSSGAGGWATCGRSWRPATAVSLLDRLLHHSVVVLTDGESFRMREAGQRGGGRRPQKS